MNGLAESGVMTMLDHIEIYVSHLGRSRSFYDFLLSRLGWKLYQEWDAGFSYRLAAYYLVFVQTESRFLTHIFNRKHTGLNHLAFQMSSIAEINVLRTALLEYGVHELYADRFPHAGGEDYYAFYFEDPDRIKLEIVLREKI